MNPVEPEVAPVADIALVAPVADIALVAAVADIALVAAFPELAVVVDIADKLCDLTDFSD